MPYQHGVRVLEQPTGVAAPISGTAGLQVVFGTAPVNLAKNPAGVTNKPVICYTWQDAVDQLGYSDDWASYTLCQSMYASFKLFGVSPVVFVNVLDPSTHKTEVSTAAELTVTSRRAVLTVAGVLKSTVVVKSTSSGEPLTVDTDYVLSFTKLGSLEITLLATGSAASATKLYVTYTKLNPSAVTASNIIGAVSGNTETGLEVLRQVYPKFGMVPGLIIAPGWSQDSDVSTALAAKCEEINGYFSCESYVDIDCNTTDGCTLYSNVGTAKTSAAISSPHVMALWPCVKSGTKIFFASAVWAALTQYTDAQNDDVPNLSPSNRSLPITATCLQDGTEVLIDQTQGNTINGYGVSTAINVNGFRTWGNNSAAYPDTTDPKDRWFACRRFFSWWGNSFIQTYFQNVDDPADFRLVESIVDSENIRGNAYVSAGKCAAAYIEFNEAENTTEDILEGRITFRQHLSPYVPAEDILNILEFDPEALAGALTGGES